jgi:hypothetical protein
MTTPCDGAARRWLQSSTLRTVSVSRSCADDTGFELSTSRAPMTIIVIVLSRRASPVVKRRGVGSPNSAVRRRRTAGSYRRTRRTPAATGALARHPDRADGLRCRTQRGDSLSRTDSTPGSDTSTPDSSIRVSVRHSSERHGCRRPRRGHRRPTHHAVARGGPRTQHQHAPWIRVLSTNTHRASARGAPRAVPPRRRATPGVTATPSAPWQSYARQLTIPRPGAAIRMTARGRSSELPGHALLCAAVRAAIRGLDCYGLLRPAASALKPTQPQ